MRRLCDQSRSQKEEALSLQLQRASVRNAEEGMEQVAGAGSRESKQEVAEALNPPRPLLVIYFFHRLYFLKVI